jgi:SpoVK/Ycf46/Vps4 family AAA+-type ATPase
MTQLILFNIHLIMTELLFTMMISTALITMIQQLINSIYLPDIWKTLVIFLEQYRFKSTHHEIILSSTSLQGRFGSQSKSITPDKLAVLYYIQKHMAEFPNLYKLSQDYISSGYLGEAGYSYTQFYKMAQHTPIIIQYDNSKYIKIRSIDTNKTKGREDNVTMTKTNELILSSNDSLLRIDTFIKDCVLEKEQDDMDDTTQYIYHYLGEDTKTHELLYNKEIFVPYADFSGLIGDNIRNIEDGVDFFKSDIGRQWYKDRNIPYQLTHLYHGLPGTGKSIIASAIASKFKLDIIKIKLSGIKTEREFCKVFKNINICGRKYDYTQLLYLFDEVDIELEKLHNLNKQPLGLMTSLSKDSPSTSDTYVLPPNNLTIGTLLEEFNGVTQMYGRLMILITNNFSKLNNIHNGALIRPGRVDRCVEFTPLCNRYIRSFIKLWYSVTDIYIDNWYPCDKSYSITAAVLCNMCKQSESVEILCSKIKKDIPPN